MEENGYVFVNLLEFRIRNECGIGNSCLYHYEIGAVEEYILCAPMSEWLRNGKKALPFSE